METVNPDGVIPAEPLDANGPTEGYAEAAGANTRVRKSTKDSLVHEFARIARYAKKIAKRAGETNFGSVAAQVAQGAEWALQMASGFDANFAFSGASALKKPSVPFRVGDKVLPNEKWMDANKGVIDFAEVDLPATLSKLDGHRVCLEFTKDGKLDSRVIMSVSHIVRAE